MKDENVTELKMEGEIPLVLPAGYKIVRFFMDQNMKCTDMLSNKGC
jgi:hypothetical protein